MLTTKLTSGSIIGTICLDKSMLSLARWGWSTMAWQGLAQKYIKHIGKP